MIPWVTHHSLLRPAAFKHLHQARSLVRGACSRRAGLACREGIGSLTDRGHPQGRRVARMRIARRREKCATPGDGSPLPARCTHRLGNSPQREAGNCGVDACGAGLWVKGVAQLLDRFPGEWGHRGTPKAGVRAGSACRGCRGVVGVVRVFLCASCRVARATQGQAGRERGGGQLAQSFSDTSLPAPTGRASRHVRRNAVLHSVGTDFGVTVDRLSHALRAVYVRGRRL